MKTSKSTIDQFFAEKKLAIAGVSRNQKKFGYIVFKELREKGFEVYPINPNTGNIDDVKTTSSVLGLPSDVNRLIILTPKKETLNVVTHAHEKGIRHIWIQQMSETPEAIEFSKDKFETVIAKQCIMMFADPVAGFHKFHRSIKKIFGMLPK